MRVDDLHIPNTFSIRVKSKRWRKGTYEWIELQIPESQEYLRSHAENEHEPELHYAPHAPYPTSVLEAFPPSSGE